MGNIADELEWDEKCPACGGETAYEGTTYAGEIENWSCKKCGASLDVPIEVRRFSAITVWRDSL